MAMKRRKLWIFLLLAAALLTGCVLAAGGDAGDPLVSRAYLQDVFAPKAESAAQDKLDVTGWNAYGAAEAKWRAAVSAADSSAGTERTAVWTEACLKRGDVISVSTGAQVLLLAGNADAHFTGGAVVDATDGTELAPGGTLRARHRYLVAEDTAACCTVTSRTAVVQYCGNYHITCSENTPDYYAMASALRSLSLFRGTDTGYGGGFDLEAVPSRIQALVMLIRMLGEEQAALACTAPVPFTDVAENYWGRPYIAYAYEKGYTNGVEGNKFAPDRATSDGMYVEFVLRALGYSDTTQTDVSTAAERAFTDGIITAGESFALRANEFLRADVVYLSWYALETPRHGEERTLAQSLQDAGVFTAADYARACGQVGSQRL